VPFDRIEDVLGRITDAPPKVMRRIDRMRSVMGEMLGVEYCHYAIDPATGDPNETNTTMCAKAARPALQSAGVAPEDVELLVYAGVLYDTLCPPNSVFVQEELGIPYCAEIAVHSNCTAIYKALQVGADAIANGRYDTALIVTSQLSSPFLRAGYFNQSKLTQEQAVLRWFLSDGAGALVLTAHKPPGNCLRVVDTYLESVGVGIEPTMRMLVGAVRSEPLAVYEHGWHHLTQDLKTVAKLAPELGAKGFDEMLQRWQLDLSRLRCVFLNIPTKHMLDLGLELVRERLGNPNVPFYTKLSTRGYPGAPAIVIALDEYLAETQLNEADQLLSFVTESSKWMHAGFLLEWG
jgi:3-oxoacyl-[acyl-carrier-protein] synthase III